MNLPLDVQSLRDLLKGPGMDSREWVSYGTVDKEESPEDRPIEFSEEYGPLVNITLQPSGVQVRARVAGFIAGNGEGCWYPFLPGDEVIAILPDGLTSSAVIIGRLNQEIDKFPTIVAGNEVSSNTFGFWRHVAPFIIETKETFMIFNPVHTAAFIMEAGGNVTLRDGLLSFLHLGADFLGIQTNDGGMLFQMNLDTNVIRLAHNADVGQPSAIFDINGSSSSFATGGTLSLATAGNFAQFHGITFESVLALIMAVNQATATAIAALGGPAAYLAAVWSAPGPISAIPGGAIVEPALPVTSALPFSPVFQQSLNTLLAVPKVLNVPGLACPGLTLG